VPPLRDFEAFLPTGKPSGALALLTVVVIATSFGLTGLQSREEIVPDLPALNTFPLRVAGWRGNETAMEQVYLNKLKLDDYVMAQYYREDDAAAVDLYIAYYASQRKGASVHSPKACLPGGGWEIVDLQQTAIPDVGPDEGPLNVNRVVIQLGDTRQLVYYWFQQRDRIVTNEYLVKWFIFWDALTKNRTDGSLIRLVTVVPPSDKIEDADARMQEFLRDIDPTLAYFLPRDVTNAADTG
jgi:EpsI family protein